jgi:hypothetical protein
MPRIVHFKSTNRNNKKTKINSVIDKLYQILKSCSHHGNQELAPTMVPHGHCSRAA